MKALKRIFYTGLLLILRSYRITSTCSSMQQIKLNCLVKTLYLCLADSKRPLAKENENDERDLLSVDPKLELWFSFDGSRGFRRTGDLLFNSCVGHTSRALWAAGIPNIYLFHPIMLNLQLVTRQIGIYSSPFLYQKP